MLAMHPEGNIQALAAIKRLTNGTVVRLQPHDEVTLIEDTDEGVYVWITRLRIEERKSDIKVTARGVCLVVVSQSETWSGWRTDTYVGWDREQCMTNMMNAVTRGQIDTAQMWKTIHDKLPEEPFEPIFINHYGPGKSVGEWLEQRSRERMAGRVGTSSHPMDTHERSIAYDGQYTSARMTKHWN